MAKVLPAGAAEVVEVPVAEREGDFLDRGVALGKQPPRALHFDAVKVPERALSCLACEGSSMRLHLQAHPTREFARQHLGQSWGKLEAYVILSTRPGCEPFIRLGFQHPPTPEEWQRIVIEQDIAAMDACFEPVPVRPGQVWFVPGGLPHAIGGGLTVLEIMEPSDLVVRCEFEREGIVVPPSARFMGREPADALRIFDFTPGHWRRGARRSGSTQRYWARESVSPNRC